MKPFRLKACAPLALVALVQCSASAKDEGGVPDPDLRLAPMSTTTTDGGKLQLEVRTSPDQPPTRGTSTVALRALAPDNGAPIDDLALTATPWMPAHGHGTSVKTEVEGLGDGVYMIRHVYLYMGGEWELRLSFDGPLRDEGTLHFSIR